MSEAIQLLVGTRKGAWIYRSDAGRTGWTAQGPIFLGCIISHLVLDPRDGKTLLMAAATGHLGPTVFSSTDDGETWTEAQRPPAFPKTEDPATGRAVDHTFWLEPGHPSEPGVWWAGTSPPGLFESRDGGATWDSVSGFNDHPNYRDWVPAEAGTPDGPLLNQVVIDPRDAAHMYLATSTAGVFESHDRGATWTPLNQNVEANFLPDPYPEYGQDAHFIALAPTNPDRLWQQNHCGIYRLDRPSDRWERIGNAMPTEIGDIGFTIVPHARDAETAWVFPMDGTQVWPRTSPGGRPAVYRTADGGASWDRQDAGFPTEQGWFTVKRQAFCADRADPLGLYLGTTGGELWMSGDEGGSWRQIAAHLPEIYSVVAAPLP
ncbi:glycosyl hydrolase [Phenylobacterium hankyongense]|uniref:Glycosyl hydrolase n=1 Tax=Phenylobacterium hankyongense TaxID=1813876 RepID=A0A328AW38_9CAUL|nr:sialidase family protein [Phenylobacterium hankyongense]RAK59203.1 glycosyl hydrolase [Phenylobacterium hankyongense]